jgi:hypothetical protein
MEDLAKIKTAVLPEAEGQQALFDVGERKLTQAPPPPPPEPKKPEPPDWTVPLPFPKLTGAIFDDTRTYRYALWRVLREKGDTILWIGLNPSTADEDTDDPTIRRVVNYSKAWGYANVLMANLFAFRATDPKEMKKAADPFGKDNKDWLIRLRKQSAMCIVGWGNAGSTQYAGRRLIKLFGDLGLLPVHCLGVNNTGHPKHPLYLSRDAKPRVFAGPLVLSAAVADILEKTA